jgi:DNA-binding LacI/PurR family transcriptional regulator
MSMILPRDEARRPTIYDVADRAGVSKSLVSQVLQGNSRVSERRREAVLTAIAELGYRPSRAATLLASRRTKSIEVLVDDYRNLSFIGLVTGVQSAVADHGYHLTVTDTQLNAHLGTAGRGSVLSTNLDGLIVAGEPDEDLLRGFQGPVVVAGWRSWIPAGADLVANDDEFGGAIAADHLVQLGHRSIGHLTGSSGPAAHRRAGFEARLQTAGLPGIVTGGDNGTAEEDGYRTATTLLDENPGVTAIFAANDTMVLGALAAIRLAGRSVPGDISVVGYDNSPVAQSRYLAITSVDDRSEDVGAAAGLALLDRIADPTIAPRRTLLQPSLAVRDTTGPVR